MKTSLNIVVLGLSLSSSWGNGHATTYRSLLRALYERGHHILFLERERLWYANARDLRNPPYCTLRYYHELDELKQYREAVETADAVIIGSYVPNGIEIADWVFSTAMGTVAFYDIDTPVTLRTLATGECEYISPAQIPLYDLYLSFAGGPILSQLKERWGALAPRALYCSADTSLYRPIATTRQWVLGYLGTFSPDRQEALEKFIIEPALRAPHLRFVVAGAQYPNAIRWPKNVDRIEHVSPPDHPRFYARLEWTLNVTRSDMREVGFGPSVRLFEAAACGTPIISDWWTGLDTFLARDTEIIVAADTKDILSALKRTARQRQTLAANARRAVLRKHTAVTRAAELESILTGEIATRRPARGRRQNDKVGEITAKEMEM